jgi:hypothetical protein
MTHITFSSVTALTIVLAVAGCGATPTEPIEPAPAAQVIATTSRATRLQDYRQMIVGLYRVPGAERSGEDPLDTLWRSLATQYGPVLRPDTRGLTGLSA